MQDGRTARVGYSRRAVALGWAIAGVYLLHQIVTVSLARTDRVLPLREELRGWHYLVGTLLFLLAAARLWTWVKDARPTPPPGLPASAFLWGRTLALASYLLILVAPFLGLLWAGSGGLDVHLGPTPSLPSIVGPDRELWLFSGYFHSGLGFMLLVLNFAALLTAAYTLLRFGRGLLNALPPGYGAFALIGASMTVYSFATFRSPEPGIPALLGFWGVVAVVWLLGRLVRGRRGPREGLAMRPGPVAPLVAGLAALLLVGTGAYGPYALFRVSPLATGDVVEAPGGVTSHAAPLMQVSVAPATEFERRVAADTFKWCAFCHTFERGGEHKLGPNLYAIFGQRAGTVPNFPYSDAMAGARARGLVWTEDNLAAYVADPQRFMPGTTMIISSGPIEDPREQAAVINILKRATMGDAATTASR